MVNGAHVISSPLSASPSEAWVEAADDVSGPLWVAPAELYAPACIVDELPLEMMAGTESTARIQTRDFYSNNMKSLLAEATQVWRAQIVYTDPSGGPADIVASEGTIEDKAGGDEYRGVYEVAFTPTLAGTAFKILLSLNGLDVDATADYRSKPLVVLPAETTSAIHSNYSILIPPGQSMVQYTD